jgi:tRNA 2-thiouridine synthesizing protein A
VAEAVPDQTLDLRGSSSPVPVVRTAKAMKALDPGSVLELISAEAGVEELHAWSARAGHELLSVAEQEGGWHLLVRKAGTREGRS